MSNYLTLRDGRKIELLSDEEDAVITAAALADPDNPPVTDFSGFKRAGRPFVDNPKVSTTVRFDAEVMAYFKATGKGWQTRMNMALREYIQAHPTH